MIYRVIGGWASVQGPHSVPIGPRFLFLWHLRKELRMSQSLGNILGGGYLGECWGNINNTIRFRTFGYKVCVRTPYRKQYYGSV